MLLSCASLAADLVSRGSGQCRVRPARWVSAWSSRLWEVIPAPTSLTAVSSSIFFCKSSNMPGWMMPALPLVAMLVFGCFMQRVKMVKAEILRRARTPSFTTTHGFHDTTKPSMKPLLQHPAPLQCEIIDEKIYRVSRRQWKTSDTAFPERHGSRPNDPRNFKSKNKRVKDTRPSWRIGGVTLPKNRYYT